MVLTPFFLGLLFLTWFPADVLSVQVLPDVLKGTSVVLSPDDAETRITAITWKYGADLAAEWFGGDPTFYRMFNNTCSLNTETGDLTINDVTPQHSGVYTPEINGKTRSAMKLRVLSPVPKPSITIYCNPEETKCSLTCSFDRTEDLGDLEVFWILDDSHERGGRKLQITEEMKEGTFICSLKNSVSSENSFKLQNPLLPGETGVPVWIPVVGTLAVVAVLALLVFVCWRWIIPKRRHDRIRRILKEICDTKLSEESFRISEEIHDAESVTDVEPTLWNVDQVIMRILEKKELKLSEDDILMLLTVRYLILKILQQGPEGKKSLKKVKEMIENFFKVTNEKQLSEAQKMIEMFFKGKYKTWLNGVHQRIWKILTKEDLQLSEDEETTLRNFHIMIDRVSNNSKNKGVSDDKQSPQNGGFEITFTPRDPAEEPLNSSSSRYEAEDPV